MKQLLFVYIVLAMISCKKKKEETPNPPVPSTPARANNMSAILNGKVWTVTNNQTSTANIDQSVYNSSPKQYVVAGRTHPTLNKNSIYVGFTYTTGTVDLAVMSNFYAAYVDSTGTGYPATSGTLNIALIDTSHLKSTACDKFKATFSFVTSAILGVSYTVTQGTVDFEAK